MLKSPIIDFIIFFQENTDSRKRENLNQRTYSEFINEELIDFCRLDIRVGSFE